MLFEEVAIAFHLAMVELALQEDVRPHPWFHRRPAMRTAGNELLGQGIATDGVAQPHHLIVIVVDAVVAGQAALPIAPVALDACDVPGGENTEELRVLISGHHVVIPILQQFRQIAVRAARSAFINITCSAQDDSPTLARRQSPVVKRIEHTVYAVFPSQATGQPTVHLIILIIEHKARRGGHPRCSAHYNGIRLAYLFPQQLNFFC